MQVTLQKLPRREGRALVSENAGDECYVERFAKPTKAGSIWASVLRLILSMATAPLFPPIVEIDPRRPGFRIVGQASKVNSESRGPHLE